MWFWGGRTSSHLAMWKSPGGFWRACYQSESRKRHIHTQWELLWGSLYCPRHLTCCVTALYICCVFIKFYFSCLFSALWKLITKSSPCSRGGEDSVTLWRRHLHYLEFLYEENVSSPCLSTFRVSFSWGWGPMLLLRCQMSGSGWWWVFPLVTCVPVLILPALPSFLVL